MMDRAGTLLRDEVEYAPPLGVVGRLLAGGLLESKLQKMFDYRHEITRRIVESGDFLHPVAAGLAAKAGAGPEARVNP